MLDGLVQVESSALPETRFVSFDFHKECKGMKYENLAKLTQTVQDEFPNMGWFQAEVAPEAALAGGSSSSPSSSSAAASSSGVLAPALCGLGVSVQRQQRGVFRTNCMDCLDRTNVVQNVFAEAVLDAQLRELGLVAAEDVAAVQQAQQQAAAEVAAAVASGKKKPKVNPITLGLLYKISQGFAFTYKGLWADNADRMSVLYSGTGALKTDYTRTGKRTVRRARTHTHIPTM
jgi:hypothetical protein